ncbi:predicted protein [Nematostella vectensis]|uniref:Sulfotransferase domain-containing protein n=1 Tax=Nematostella vectensis TaxID=45351 RepID=A7RP28_NEMVE|nr:predicted protein [Nematostella vectensis]|eukprot:XP_001638903.1 predicted protein [Nematostella vectensis]
MEDFASRVRTTWVEEIVWQLHHDGKLDDRPTFVRIPFLEIQPSGGVGPEIEKVDKLVQEHKPRIFKSHFGYDIIPKGNAGDDRPKYVCVMRNPKDVAVSLFHFYRGIHHILYEGTWDEFFELFIKGDVLYGSWFDHVLSWWEHRDDPNVLLLKYEDMVKDRLGAIKQIASFVDKNISPDLVQLVADQTSFDAMKDMPMFSLKGFYKETEKFMRKGKVGDWVSYFSREQSERLDAIYNERIRETGLEFDFQ